MKLRRLRRYDLVVLGLLCVGVMFLPDRAMAPPPIERPPVIEKEMGKQRIEKITPKPQIGPIQISGNVTIPDGRGLGGVKIKIYELRDGSFSWVKDLDTTKTGYFSTTLGEQWFNKRVKLIPKYAHFREGEHFYPQEQQFQIISAKMENRNFRYNGHLPDLTIPRATNPFEHVDIIKYEVRDAKCFVCTKVVNEGSIESGPFKVKFTYIDRRDFVLKEKNQPATSITPQGFIRVCVELGPVTERGFGPFITCEDHYHLSSIRLDYEDSVIESNENNNFYPW